MPTNYSKGYWTDGKVDPITNIRGTGTFIAGTPPQSYTDQVNSYSQTQPTVSDIYNSNASNPSLPTLDTSNPEDTYNQNNPVESDAATQARVLRLFQSQIDATNQIYGQKLAEAKQQGLGRLGSVTAMNARGGLIGSDFGATRQTDMENANTAVLSGIRQEQAAKLAEIQGLATNMSSQEIARKNTARKEGLESYLKNEAGKLERKKANIGQIVDAITNQGFDINTLDSTWLEETAKRAGVTVEELKAAALDKKMLMQKEQAEVNEAAADKQYARDIEQRKLELDEAYKMGQLSTDQYQAQTARLKYDLDAKKEAAVPESNTFKSDVATQGRSAVSNMLSIAQANPGIFGRTAGLPIPDLARSDAYRNYQAQIDYLKGNIIPAALGAMRDASKTGGALGAVSDREGAWLASSLGALDMKQSPEAVIKQLKAIDASLSRWQTAVDKHGNQQTSQPSQMQLPNGTVLNLQPDGTYQ